MKASTRFCEIFAFLGFTGWMRERSHAQVNRSNSWPPYFLQKLSTGVKTLTSQECSLCACRHRLRQLQHESVACRGLQLGQSAIFFLHHWQQISFPVCNQLSKLEPGNPVPLKYNLCNIQTKERTRPHQQSCTLAVSSIFYTIKAKKATRRKG